MAFTAPYAASKHAIEALGDALRVELRKLARAGRARRARLRRHADLGQGAETGDRGGVPPELQKQYGNVPAAMDKALQDTAKRGVPAEQVAQTIERALTARRMRALRRRARRARDDPRQGLLPDHVFDRVAKRVLGV